MNKFRLVSLFIIFSVMLHAGETPETTVVPKSGTSGAHFLSISPDAQFAGMGNASSAYPINKASGIFYNPARLVYLNRHNFFVNHTPLYADIAYTSAAYAYILGNHAFGLHYRGMNTGEMEETTIEFQNGTGNTFSWKSMAIGGTYAIRLTDKFSFGTNIYYVTEGVGEYSMTANALGVDLSTYYITGFKSLNLGMIIKNFGPELNFNQSFVDYADGDSVDTINYRPYHMPLTFQVGVSYDFFYLKEGKSLLLAIDGVHPNDSVERFNIGLEYTYKSSFSARCGLYTNHDTASLMGGGGINFKQYTGLPLKVDYSISNYGILGFVQQFSLNYSL